MPMHSLLENTKSSLPGCSFTANVSQRWKARVDPFPTHHGWTRHGDHVGKSPSLWVLKKNHDSMIGAPRPKIIQWKKCTFFRGQTSFSFNRKVHPGPSKRLMFFSCYPFDGSWVEKVCYPSSSTPIFFRQLRTLKNTTWFEALSVV